MFNDFAESEPFSTHFEEIGYDSANFFLLIGAMLIMIIIFIVYFMIRKPMQICALRSNDNCFSRRCRPSPGWRGIMYTFYFESVIELTLGATICFKMMTEDNFVNFKEGLQTSCALFTLVLGVVIPIYLVIAARRHYARLEEGYPTSSFSDLFEGYKDYEFLALLYPVIFITRRVTFILVMIRYPYTNWQVFTHIHFSLM